MVLYIGLVPWHILPLATHQRFWARPPKTCGWQHAAKLFTPPPSRSLFSSYFAPFFYAGIATPSCPFRGVKGKMRCEIFRVHKVAAIVHHLEPSLAANGWDGRPETCLHG